MTNKIKIGIVGLGAAGEQVAKQVMRHPGYVLTAVADTNLDRIEEYRKRDEISVFDQLETMCQSADMDVVYVATPNKFHAEHTVTAAFYKKNVIVEKPMAMTMEECDSMINAVEKSQVKLMVAHTRSFNPPIRKMREIISSGEIGKVIQISTLHYSPWLVRPRLATELESSLGGGVCFRQAPHQVDITRLLGGGNVTSVRALTGRWDANSTAEGNYSAFLEFDNGAVATLVYNGYGYFDTSELTFGIGGNGKARKPGGGQRLREFVAKGATKDDARSGKAHEIEGGNSRINERHQPFFGLTIISCERGDIRQSPDGIRIYDQHGIREIECSPWIGPLQVELDDFYAAVIKDSPVLHDGYWGMATLEVCLAIMKSSEEKREVPVFKQVASRY
jgi:phthalate 4,5-cis-dihydrodiol dehydrogenase